MNFTKRVNQRHSDGDLLIEKEDDDLEIEDINDEEILDEINKSLATIFKFKKEKSSCPHTMYIV